MYLYIHEAVYYSSASLLSISSRTCVHNFLVFHHLCTDADSGVDVEDASKILVLRKYDKWEQGAGSKIQWVKKGIVCVGQRSCVRLWKVGLGLI